MPSSTMDCGVIMGGSVKAKNIYLDSKGSEHRLLPSTHRDPHHYGSDKNPPTQGHTALVT